MPPDPVAVVTGGRRGIGSAIALELARDGYTLVVNDVELDDDAQQTLSAIHDSGGAAIAIPADVSDAAAVQHLVAQILRQFGRIDVWVNNAAVGRREPFVDVSEQHWDHIIAVDLKGPFLCGQAAARQMIAQGTGGSIVNIGSVHGVRTWPDRSVYAVAKAGLARLTASMAYELGPHGIRVNAVAPGYVDSRAPDPAELPIGKPSYASQVVPHTPLRRIGVPADIAHAVSFLVSPRASFVTGQCMTVDGGLLIGGSPEEG
jgi:NAD(P)-dependent dehydrogenase (short-subunit alcohol dehydrogenase family)